MSDSTRIEWTQATWNVVTGCTRISPGCAHCYIERTPPFRMAGRRFNHTETGATTGIRLHPERLDQPLRWRKPRRVFVCSLADLFHTAVPARHIADVWAMMALTPQHTFQVLTKRHGRMRALLTSDDFRTDVQRAVISRVGEGIGYQMPVIGRWPLPNVWLGVSAEDQAHADLRIPALLDTPAAVRWVSAEPLLGPIKLADQWIYDRDPAECTCYRYVIDYSERSRYHRENIDVERDDTCPVHGDRAGLLDWIVIGGESGPDARPMAAEWAEQIVNDCDGVVPVFMKQLGTRHGRDHHDIETFPPPLRVRQYPAVHGTVT